MVPANKSENTRSSRTLPGAPAAKAGLIALAVGLMTLQAGATQVTTCFDFVQNASC